VPRAAVLTNIHQPLEILDLELDAPRAGELSVTIVASGVCHSDLSIQDGSVMVGALPMVLGHEGAGVVTAVGPEVTGFAEGDHVVISWVPQCGTCFFCARGEGHLCESGMGGLIAGGLPDGTTRFSRSGSAVHQMACSGTFAEETIIPATGAVRIDRDIPLTSAALLGCAVLTGVGAALNTARLRQGATVAVVGCGGVGMNVIQGARLAGAAEIIAVDTRPEKLELAKQFGATQLVEAADGEAVEAVRELTGRGVDVGFEVVGLPATIEQTLAMVRRGGEVILVGAPPADVVVGLPVFPTLIFQSKTIRGCYYGSTNVAADVPRLLDHYRNGELLLDELISRTISLEQVNDALHAVDTGTVLRSVIRHG
jgi:NDMA-dependent alcohol dehydrogenase